MRLVYSGALALVIMIAVMLTPAQAAPPAPTPDGQIQELTTEDVDDWLDGMIPAMLSHGNVPGATVSVVKDGELVTARGYGSANAWNPGVVDAEPVDPQRHLFRIGSVSKLTAAVAALQLVEDGTIDLHGDVRDYVDIDLDLPHGVITPHHLMTHTAGFEEYLGESFMVSDPQAFPGLREVLLDQPIQIVAPGTRSAYSNYGSALLGYIVEHQSGMDFDDYVATHIFEPLGMDHSTTAQPLPENHTEDIADGFTSPDQDTEPQHFELIGPAPAGSQSSTSVDMATFANFLLGHEPHILEPETLAQMSEPALDTEAAPQHANATNTIGLQVWLAEVNGQPAFGHGGDTRFFHSQLVVFPEQDMGIFISQNGMGSAETDLRTQLVQQFANRYVAEPTGAPAAHPDSRAEADALAGRYQMSRHQESGPVKLMNPLGEMVLISHDDGTLQLQGSPARYQLVEPGTWRLAVGPAFLGLTEFSTDGETIVVAPGHELIPSPMLEQRPVVLTLVIGSVLVGVIAMITGIVGVFRRHRLRRAGNAERPGPGLRWSRRAMLLVGVGMIGAVAGVAAFGVLAMAEQGAGTAYRVVQAFGLLTALGGVGAAVRSATAIRARHWRAAVGPLLVMLAAVMFCGLLGYYNFGLLGLRF